MNSLAMLPVYSPANTPNMLRRYAVTLRKFWHWDSIASHGSYFSDLTSGKFCKINLFSLAKLVSLFRGHVAIIIATSSEPQMIRIHARRNIAGVADAESFRNTSPNDHPHYSIGAHGSIATAELECSVSAASKYIRCPKPAIIWPSLVYLRPKSLKLLGRKFDSINWFFHAVNLSPIRSWRKQNRIAA